MSSLPLRIRLLLLLAAIFGFLALAGFGEGLAQVPAPHASAYRPNAAAHCAPTLLQDGAGR